MYGHTPTVQLDCEVFAYSVNLVAMMMSRPWQWRHDINHMLLYFHFQSRNPATCIS